MTIIFITKQTDGNFSVRLDGPDVFREAVQTLKEHVPSHRRSYDPQRRVWIIKQCAVEQLRRWLNYAEYTLGAEVEYEEQPLSETASAFTVLHLLPSAPPELIKAAYRCLAQLHHPDRGGDGEEMKRINSAFESITRGLATA